MQIYLVCNSGKDQNFGLTKAKNRARLISYALMRKDEKEALQAISKTGYAGRYVPAYSKGSAS